MTESTPQLAKQWQQNMTTISRNLMELAETEMVKGVKAKSKHPDQTYSGVTQERATQALKALDSLWASYLLLAGVVDEAVELAGKSGFLLDYSAQVHALLEGESVALPVDHLPITNRGLLAAADQVTHVTPQTLLSAMERLFDEARETFVRIATAQSSLQARVDALQQEITSLTAWRKTLGVTLPSLSISDPHALLAEVIRDPLGCAQDVEEIEAELHKSRLLLQGVVDERQSIRQSLDRAQIAITELAEVVQDVNAVWRETQAKILHPPARTPPLSTEGIASLQAWHQTLSETLKLGRSAAVKVGVNKLLNECNEQIRASKSALDHNRALLDEREELYGRFKALSIKAKAYRGRAVGMETEIETIAQQTRLALAAQPIDLPLSRQLVQVYGQALARGT